MFPGPEQQARRWTAALTGGRWRHIHCSFDVSALSRIRENFIIPFGEVIFQSVRYALRPSQTIQSMTGESSHDRRDSVPAPVTQYQEMTAFERDLLLELAKLEASTEDAYGLALKARLEDWYGTELNPGRLYQNLDKLVQRGVIQKGQIDDRTNEYRLTDVGHQALEVRYRKLESIVN